MESYSWMIMCVAILLFSGSFIFTQAHSGNCTEEHRQEHLDKCSDILGSDALIFSDKADGEDIFKDPIKFVYNPELCNSTKGANYMECVIGVFELCATNTSMEDAHTSPANAKQAVEGFCASLKTAYKKVNQTTFEECVKEHEVKAFSCATEYDVKESIDICNEHELYTACIAPLDECTEDEDNAPFTHWAKMMTPQKCTNCGSTAFANLFVVFAVGLYLFSYFN